MLPHKSVTTFTATLPPLELAIARTNNNVTLSWPVGAAGFVLQRAPQLALALPWSEVTSVPTVMGGTKWSLYQSIRKVSSIDCLNGEELSEICPTVPLLRQ